MNNNDDTVLYNLGVDLNSTLEFKDGDIILCEYEENLSQAIRNRLNTRLGECDLYYEEYGTILTGFMGWKKSEAIDYIQAEVENVLDDEPRVTDYATEVTYLQNGRIRIGILLHTGEDININMDLVLGATGVLELDENEVVGLEEAEEAEEV